LQFCRVADWTKFPASTLEDVVGVASDHGLFDDAVLVADPAAQVRAGASRTRRLLDQVSLGVCNAAPMPAVVWVRGVQVAKVTPRHDLYVIARPRHTVTSTFIDPEQHCPGPKPPGTTNFASSGLHWIGECKSVSPTLTEHPLVSSLNCGATTPPDRKQ
jgi:hypothetical protein